MVMLKDNHIDFAGVVAEALKSMMLRTQSIKHPLQKKTDKAVITKGSGQDLYAITIDYDKF